MSNKIKPFTTYAQQIEILRSHGCLIRDEAQCQDALSSIGYYRFTAYFLPFKQSDGQYVEGTNFDTVFNIYEFDRKLRNILFGAIEEIEVYLRAKLSYYHAEKYGPIGYQKKENFSGKHDQVKLDNNIKREIENNQNSLFVKHHINRYDGVFPLWVVAELFTFGMLSYFYNDLLTRDQKEFARSAFQTDYKSLKSWLRCCTDLRNICAHYGRLYYRVFSAIPYGLAIPDSEKRRLWGAVLVVKLLYPSAEKWNSCILPSIQSLFNDYQNYINLYHLAFPNNWKEELRK